LNSPDSPRIVVTGADGYLGRRIVDAFRGRATVIPFTRQQTPLQDRVSLTRLLAALQPDHVIHAAGQASGDAAALELNNVRATETLADALLDAAPHSLLTSLGSAAEYGQTSFEGLITEKHACEPLDDYGRTKLAATRALLQRAERSGLRVNVIRPFNPVAAPLSTRQVLGSFVDKARAARASGMTTVTMGRLDAIRDIFAATDLMDLIREIVLQGRHGLVVNACSGIPRRIRDVVWLLNAQPGGGFRIEESGPASETENVAVGDPSLFLTLIGRSATSPIEPILAAAWQQVMIERGQSGHPNSGVKGDHQDCARSSDA
jgi:nucleoside-diphosphate-sugar epimerase